MQMKMHAKQDHSSPAMAKVAVVIFGANELNLLVKLGEAFPIINEVAAVIMEQLEAPLDRT